MANRYKKETHTPLYYAAVYNRRDAVELLLSYGADPIKYNEDSCTVLEGIVRRRSWGNYQMYWGSTMQLFEDYTDRDGRQIFSMTRGYHGDMDAHLYDPRIPNLNDSSVMDIECHVERPIHPCTMLLSMVMLMLWSSCLN